MGYKIQDRIEVYLYFNDVEYPLDSVNVLNFIHIGASIRNSVSTVHLSVTDEMGILARIGLVQDATPIRIVTKVLGSGESITYRFRLFNWKETRATIGTTYDMDGYWDAPKYWLTTSSAGIRGTSNEVLSEIASICGLEYEGIGTNDTQLWMQQNRTYAEFARFITKRGWINNQSFMALGMNTQGKLLYKNLNEHKSNNQVYEVIQGIYEEGKITSFDFQVKSNSGFNNKFTGYWNTRRQQSVVGTQAIAEYNELEFTSDSRSPLYSTKMKRDSQRGYQLYSPISAGNTHEAYEQAAYQNLRYANLLNMGIDIGIGLPTPIDLMSSINFVSRLHNGDIDNAYSGLYKCTSKAIVIEGPNYFEKVEGYRHGTNLRNESE